MRFTLVLPLALCLAACHHGLQSNDAVRQGVIDHLSKRGLNVAAMDITLSSVQFSGNSADAAISMTLKGQSGGMPMNFKYHLEQQNNKWVVTGMDNSTHGNPPAGGGTNPHGGGMPEGAPGAANPAMPSPSELPPATKKK